MARKPSSNQPASHLLTLSISFLQVVVSLFWHVICTGWNINSLQNISFLLPFSSFEMIFLQKSSQLWECFNYIKVKSSFILLLYTAQTFFFLTIYKNGSAKNKSCMAWIFALQRNCKKNLNLIIGIFRSVHL